MPAAVETYGEMATFASRRVPAWHMLGTVFQDDYVTTAEMLRLAHMDGWNVRLEDVLLPGRSDTQWFATVRTNPFDGEDDVLGVVKDKYRPFQNEDLFDFGDTLLAGGGRWETAGSIKGGKVVFGSLAIDHDVVIDPTGVADKIRSYLLLSSSHDGSLSIQGSITPTRVVCQNTLTAALSAAAQTYKFRHTSQSAGRIEDARQALGLAHKFMDAFEVEAQALFQTAIDDNKFFEIIKAAYPMPDEDVKGSLTKWQNKADALFDLYRSDTVAGVGVDGTAWGAYNALTERLDWFRKPRKGQADTAYIAASGFDPATNVEKGRLLKVVKSLTSTPTLTTV
jgi:phage/plasmid-like protein (TIGR03299 family)